MTGPCAGGRGLKFKYLLRGFGIGILFSAVILALSYYNKPKGDLTEEEIIQQARELGMMTEQDWKEKKIQDTLDQINEDPASEGAIGEETDPEEKAKTDAETEDGKTPSKEKPEDEKSQPEKTPESGSQTADTPENSDSQTADTPDHSDSQTADTEDEEPEEKPKKTAPPSEAENEGVAVIKVVSGMVSSEVAEDLEAQQVIEDAYDFDSYMCENGFAPLIQAGTFYVPKDASYLEIARILMRQ